MLQAADRDDARLREYGPAAVVGRAAWERFSPPPPLRTVLISVNFPGCNGITPRGRLSCKKSTARGAADRSSSGAQLVVAACLPWLAPCPPHLRRQVVEEDATLARGRSVGPEHEPAFFPLLHPAAVRRGSRLQFDCMPRACWARPYYYNRRRACDARRPNGGGRTAPYNVDIIYNVN